MEEIWKDLQGYEGIYQVSTLGRVKSLGRTVEKKSKLGKEFKMVVSEKVISGHVSDSGYIEYNIRKNGRPKTIRGHRLVAETFIENPSNKPLINHIDGDKTNNNLSNLEWSTHKENAKHALETGLLSNFLKFARSKPRRKLSTEDVTVIINRLNLGDAMGRIAKDYKVHRETIASIKYFKTWKMVHRPKGLRGWENFVDAAA